MLARIGGDEFVAATGLAPERLVLEITESGLFHNATAAVHSAESLRSWAAGSRSTTSGRATPP